MMQTFTLNTPTANPKNVIEAVARTEPIKPNAASEQGMNSFQAALTKQVKAKQAQSVNRATSANTPANHGRNVSVEASVKTQVHFTRASAVAENQEHVSATETSTVGALVEDILSAQALAPAPTASLEVDDSTTKAAQAEETTNPNLQLLMLVPAMTMPVPTTQSAEVALATNTEAPEFTAQTAIASAASAIAEPVAQATLPAAQVAATAVDTQLAPNQANTAVQDKGLDKPLDAVANKAIPVAEDEKSKPLFKQVVSELNKDHAVPINAQTQMQPLAQASQIAAQNLASSNVISAYPGKTGWDQAISQKVIWMVGQSEQSASITLNPPELGPLKIVIQVNNSQADATFISDNDEVRKALEDGMANLRDKLGESGIQLGQANVNTSQQSQQSFAQFAQNPSAAKTSRAVESEPQQVKTASLVRSSNGLVDTFV